MRRTTFGFSVGLLASLLCTACGDDQDQKISRGSAETLDDQCLPPAPPPAQLPVSATQSAAMTIMAKHSAPMSSIEVYIARLSGQGSNDLVLTLMRTTGAGAPDPSQVLATATFSSSSAVQSYNWVRVTLTTPVSVTMGQKLAIALRAAGPASVNWGAASGDIYNGGAAYTASAPNGPWDTATPPAQDLGFRSYVQ